MRQPHVRFSMDASAGDRHDMADRPCLGVRKPQLLVDATSTDMALPPIALPDLLHPYLFDEGRRKTFIADAHVSRNLLGVVDLPFSRVGDGPSSVSRDASPLSVTLQKLPWVRGVV